MHPLRVLPELGPTSLMARGPAAAASELRRFGEELAASGAAQADGRFTDDPAADELVERSPNAFLLGVLFTQGIAAERAWAGPHLLAERLGHLDMRRLARERSEVARAVAGPPALHRFVHTLPGWISGAAARLLSDYDGLAANIWPDGSHVMDVTRRLLAFEGIGEKKAVMAVEILRRHFGVALEGAECGSVAYDVHVRRVFLRAGLVSDDTPAAIAQAAREACPQSPGTLDLAAWLVGRDWCRPQRPRCDACRLSATCPRLTDRHASGVGVRNAQSSGRKSSPDSSLG